MFACSVTLNDVLEVGMAGMLQTAVTPAIAAYGHISFVASYLHLLSFGNYLARRINAGVHDGLAAAAASRLDFLYGIGNLKETARALEQVGLEISSQTVAYHVYSRLVHYPGQLVYLPGGKKLGLVDQHPVRHRLHGCTLFLKEYVEIRLRIYPEAFPLDTYARAYHILGVARIYDGLHAEICHPALLKIVGHGQQQSGLGRPHGAIAEV